MEQETTTPQEKKSKKYQVTTEPIRIHKSTAKTIKIILTKLNKKNYGKKVRPDDLILKLLSLLNDDHLEELKQATLSNADRLELAYQTHCKAHGQITKDEFFGLLLGQKSL